ncbi:MAG TPA: ComEA family DNA-binding protein [Ktedonobacterales bacterium]|nr:ComEA family DNA-binding protein [Ktedonobacterales bacterium]
MRATGGGFFGRMFGSRWYTLVSLAVSCALLAAITISVLVRMGNWPPQLALARSPVTISGPGVSPNETIQAYVLGAVRTPGVYALVQGARVHDLITAAGGVLPTADLTRVNLASPVGDGQSIYVPRVGEQVPLELGGKVDINLATAQQMHDALSITLTTARRIVTYRVKHGNFTAVSQLLLVPISKTIYDRIKDLVTV